MRIRRYSLSIIAVVLLAGCGPKVPSVTLAVEKKLNATFSNVSNVVEIEGGRVAFADPLARRFHTGDFATGAVDTVGVPVDSMPFNAPASLYKRPGWVAQLGFDTVAVVDFGATRTTLWTPAGFARVLVIPEAGGVDAGAGVRHAGTRLQGGLPHGDRRCRAGHGRCGRTAFRCCD